MLKYFESQDPQLGAIKKSIFLVYLLMYDQSNFKMKTKSKTKELLEEFIAIEQHFNTE